MREYLQNLKKCPFCNEELVIEDWGQDSKTLPRYGFNCPVLHRQCIDRKLEFWCWGDKKISAPICIVNIRYSKDKIKYVNLTIDLNKNISKLFLYNNATNISEKKFEINDVYQFPIDEKKFINKIRTLITFF